MKQTRGTGKLKRYRMTKREAKLMRHIAMHFPDGFVEQNLAASLGWPVEDVRSALETCAAFGLLEQPSQQASSRTAVAASSERVSIEDLLTEGEDESS